jgi:hypothetical protein
MDLDPDPAIFVIEAQKKSFFLLKGTFTSFFKDKKLYRSHKKEGIQVFSYLFCLMIEGSGPGPDPAPYL